MLASAPARIESAPSSGPTVRCSSGLSGAGSAPARSSSARSLAISTVKLPVMMPWPPMIGSRITGRGDDCVVEHDGEALADIGLGGIAEAPRADAVELKLTAGAPLLVEGRPAHR